MIQLIIDQMVYFAYLQSIFLIVVYLFSSKNRRMINPYLAIFVVVLMIGLTGRVIYMSGALGEDDRWIVFSELATLFFGATIYLFTKSSLNNQGFDRRDLKHYIIPVLYNLGVVYTFIVMAGIQKPKWLILCIIGLGLMVNIFYWVMSVRLFLQTRTKIEAELSYSVKSRFFLNFLICVGLCLLIWSVLFVLGTIDIKYLARTSWQLIWFCIAIVILFISFYGLQEPELYRLSLPKPSKEKYVHSKFSKADLDQLKAQLEQIMLEKKPYLNRKLAKAELAELLGVSSPEIARLLNERIGMSFFEYVNYYRIKEFLRLIQSEKAQQMTLFGLAQEAGFNSKTTFNKSFKQLMGMTPSRYFSSRKNT